MFFLNRIESQDIAHEANWNSKFAENKNQREGKWFFFLIISEPEWMPFSQRHAWLWGQNRTQVGNQGATEPLSLQDKEVGASSKLSLCDLDVIPWSFRLIEVKIGRDTMAGI